MLDDVMLSLRIAAEAHRNQRRKILNEPYINHCIKVAYHIERAGLSSDAICAALLHDVVEDCGVALHELSEAGVPLEAVNLVQLATKWWEDGKETEEDKKEYYGNILGSPEAVGIKLADRADNLRDMSALFRTGHKVSNWPKNYLRKTLSEFPPLIAASKNDYLVLQLQDAIAELTTEIASYPWPNYRPAESNQTTT